jgi:hypothetical protein
MALLTIGRKSAKKLPPLLLRLFRPFDFINELQQLLAFAIAQVKKPDAHIDRIVEGLRDASKAERQAFNAELNLHAPKNAYRKTSIRENVAPTEADVDDPTLHLGRQIYQVNNDACIYIKSLFKTTRSAIRCSRPPLVIALWMMI